MDTITQSINSNIREIVVARATPMIPSFGAPKIPKMNTPFNTTFVISVALLITVLMVTLPILRRVARYTSAIAQQIKLMATTLK